MTSGIVQFVEYNDMGNKKSSRGAVSVALFTLLVIFSLIVLPGKGNDPLTELLSLNPDNQSDIRKTELASLLELNALEPNNIETLQRIAQLQSDLSLWDDAAKTRAQIISLLQKENAEKNSIVEEMRKLAAAYENAGQTEKAREVLRSARDLAGDSPQLITDEGRLLLAENKAKEARTALKKSIRLAPNYSESYRQLSRAERKLAKPSDKARKTLEPLQDGVRTNPGSVESFLNLAEGYRKNNDPKKEEAALRRALAMQPDSVEARKRLAALLVDQKSDTEARQILEKLKAENRLDADGYAQLALLDERQGNTRSALEHYRQAYLRDSNNSELEKRYRALYKSEEASLYERLAKSSGQSSSASSDQVSSESGSNETETSNQSSKTSGTGAVVAASGKKVPASSLEGSGSNLLPETSSTMLNNGQGINESGSGSRASQEDPQKSKAEDLARQSRELAQSGNLTSAIAKASEAISTDPKNAEHFSLRASLYEKQKNYDAALRDYLKAAELNPNSPETWYAAGAIQYRKKEYAASRLSFEKSLQADNAFWKARYSVALSNEKNGNSKAAIEQYERTLQEKPDLYPAALNLGILYKNEGDFASAIKNLSRARDLKPQAAESYSQLGEIFLAKKDTSKAIDSLQKATQLEPSHKTANFNLALAYLQVNKTKEAEGAISRHLQTQPRDSSALYMMGKVMLEKDVTKASDYLQRAVAINQDNGKAWLAMALLAEKQNSDKADGYFAKAAAAQGAKYESHLNYGNYLYKNKNFVGAEKQYRNALDTGQNNRKTSLLLAQTLSAQNKSEAAAQVLQKIADKYPKDTQILEQLGLLYSENKVTYPAAIKNLESLLTIKPGHPKAVQIRNLISKMKNETKS